MNRSVIGKIYEVVIIKITDQISATANKDKKILTIKIDYSKVIDHTKKANKEVFANTYMFRISDDYTLNLQLYGKKVAKELVESGI